MRGVRKWRQHADPFGKTEIQGSGEETTEIMQEFLINLKIVGQWPAVRKVATRRESSREG